MKVSHLEFYDFFDAYCHHPNESALYDVEFSSLYEVAFAVRGYLFSGDTQIYRQCLVFMDTDRYLLVFSKTYDVHYHGLFSQMDRYVQDRSPFFNKQK